MVLHLRSSRAAVRCVRGRDQPTRAPVTGLHHRCSARFTHVSLSPQVMLPMLLNVVFDPACTEGGNAAALPAGYTRYASSSQTSITVITGRTCLLGMIVYVPGPDACLASCAVQCK